MPTCDPRLISPVMFEVLTMQPRSVLDVGVGTGKWGTLVREYTDIWCQRTCTFSPGKEGATLIDGIEICREYENPLWGNYDHVYLGDALKLLPGRQRYDLILCLEVLEHLGREDGKKLISMMLDRCSYLIVSYTNSEQGSAFGNEHERHVSRWSEDELRACCPRARKLATIGSITEAYMQRGRVGT
jgi:Methyltransferase domain